MVIGIFQHDTRDMPMKAVIDDLETVLARPGVVGGSVAQGYPWSDVYENGFACYVLHEDSEDAAREGVSSWLQTVRDTEAIAVCLAAGIGSTVTVDVGGKTDSLHGIPVRVTGRITRISDGRFEDAGPVHAGWRFFDGGTTVVLETQEGPTVALVTTRVGNMSREQFYSLGYRPEEFGIVVAKGVVSPRPAYQPIASELVTVNSPGATSADMSTFKFRRVRKPLYPLDPDARYPAQ